MRVLGDQARAPCEVVLNRLGLQTQAMLTGFDSEGQWRTVTATGRNAAVAVSAVVAAARKQGFAGRDWACAAVAMKGRV